MGQGWGLNGELMGCIWGSMGWKSRRLRIMGRGVYVEWFQDWEEGGWRIAVLAVGMKEVRETSKAGLGHQAWLRK